MTWLAKTRFWFQSLLQSRGLELRRFADGDAARLVRALSQHRVDTVLDVGANLGQFSHALRNAGYAGRIVGFEPQRAAHEALIRLSADDPDWTVAPRMALAAVDGEVELHLSANSYSSSILTMLPDHLRNAPRSRTVGTEVVPVGTLDGCDVVPATGRLFLKVDTQGFEDQVLDGARETMRHLIGLQLELSLAPLYDGQPEVTDLLRRVHDLGFRLWSIAPGFSDAEVGRTLQVDATWFRPEPAGD